MMKRTLVIQLIPILLLILAVCTPILYATITSLSTWAIALTIAWILLLIIYVSIAVIKWK